MIKKGEISKNQTVKIKNVDYFEERGDLSNYSTFSNGRRGHENHWFIPLFGNLVIGFLLVR